MSQSYSNPITGLGLAWVADMVFQSLILILIVYRIFKTRRSLRFPLVARRNVIDIIFHDGEFSIASELCTLTQLNAGAMYFGWSYYLRSWFKWFWFDHPHALRAMVLVNVPNTMTYYVSEWMNIDGVTNRLQLESVCFSEHIQPDLIFRFTISWRLARFLLEAVFPHWLAGEWLMQ